MHKKLVSARVKLLSSRAYYSAALFSMQSYEIPEKFSGMMGGPIGVDRNWNLYYDAKYVEAAPIEELSAALEHEINHLLRGHAPRAVMAHPDVWNQAGDCEINDDPELQRALPHWSLSPQKLGMEPGHIAEYYYEWILKKQQQQPKSGGQSQKSQGGQGQEQQGGGSSDKQSKDELHGCGGGSGTDGEWKPWEHKSGSGEDGLDEVTQDCLRNRVAEGIIDQIKKRSESRGTIPAGLVRWAEIRLKPIVDWRSVFGPTIRRCIGNIISGKMDYSFNRVSRRQFAFPQVPQIISPGTIQYQPKMSVVVDTSGSMDQELLEMALVEVDGIIQAYSIPVTVLSCDAEVHNIKKVWSARDIKPMGGGGTDMVRGIDVAMAEKNRPDLIVVLTDGYTPWPSDPSKYKGVSIIAGIINEGDDLVKSLPPFIKGVKIAQNAMVSK